MSQLPIERTEPASKTRIRVLILEDKSSDAELMVYALRQAGLDPQWERVETEQDFTARLTPELDLILSDYALPQFNGLLALQLVRSRGLDVPFILVSGSIGEDIAVAAMREGADDYLLKDRMARLGAAVRAALDRKRLAREVREAEKGLRESEERFRATFEQAAVGMALRGVDPRNPRWLRVNQKMCDILGYTREELLQLTSVDITPPEERGLAIDYNEQLLRGEITSYSRDKRYVRKNKQVIWANISLSAVRGPDGQPTHIISVMQDVTDRKEADEKIRRLNRVYAVLSGINTLIMRVRDRQELFNEACRIAVEHGNFGIAWVGRFDPATLEVTAIAWAGIDAENVAKSISSVRAGTPHQEGVTGRAVRQKKPVFDNNITAEPDLGSVRRQETIRRGYRSAIALPLLVDGAAIGALTLYAREPNFFNEDELRLLTELAGDISFALKHIEAQKRLKTLSRTRAVSSGISSALVRVRNGQELFQESCRIAVEDGQFPFAWIGVLDPATQDVTPVAWAGESAEELTRAKSSARDDIQGGKGAVGRAIRERRPVFNNDITAHSFGGPREKEILRLGFRSQITLPLFEDKAVIATLTMYAREPNFFDEEELKLLTEMAGDISYALEHMARQRKLDKLARIRAVSSEINAAIVRIREQEALLRETCRIATEHGKFQMVWVASLDAEKQEVRPVAWAGFSLEAAHAVSWASIGAARGTLGEVMLTRKPAIRNDIEAELPAGKLRQEAVQKGCLSTVCLPVVVDDNVVALIALFAAGRGFFDEEELALLNEVAADVSFALQAIEKQEKLEYLSYYDVLTGLPNRTLFVDRLSQQMRSRGGEQQMVALILLDLERFRNINESFGHRGGDEILNSIAQRLGHAFRGKDYLARISSNGFGAIVRGMKDAAGVVHVVENELFACFRQPFVVSDRELRVSVKAGIAMFPADGEDADTLFKNAESALKRAKASSDRYLFYAADMNAQAVHVMALETRLRKAVDAQQFVLHYQPKIDLATGRVCGLEALIRWNDPESGLVPPGRFIPMLEETGLILEVGRWALVQALADYRDWTSRGCTVPRVAVNVSAIQLQQKNFTDIVTGVVQQAGGLSQALELEITESLMMKDIEASIRKLTLLRESGIHIAMDDFGTGYSSLSYLARLPINTVKIDRAFVSDMAAGADAMSIVSAMIALTHSLNLRVVAEGVETEEQVRLLTLLKCDEAQGYFFSKPIPADQIEMLLRAPALGTFAGDSPRPSRSRKSPARTSGTGAKRRRGRPRSGSPNQP